MRRFEEAGLLAGSGKFGAAEEALVEVGVALPEAAKVGFLGFRWVWTINEWRDDRVRVSAEAKVEGVLWDGSWFGGF